VRSVRLQIAAVAILRRGVQVVVLVHELYELVLDVRQFAHGEFELVWLHLLLLEEADEADLVLQQEEQGLAATIGATTRPTDSVDVVIGIIWGVVLDDPVNLWKVETTLCNISAQEDAIARLTEFKVGACALLLFLFSVNVLDWNVHIVQQVGVELHRVAT